MRRARSILGSLVVVVAVVAAGCSGEGNDGDAGEAAAESSTTTTAPEPPVPGVTVTTREYGFEIPPVLEGGVIRMTVKNAGQRTHEAVIVAAGETPPARLTRDLTPIALGEEKPTPAYLRFHGGVSLVRAGTTAESTLTLPAGRYVLVCTLTDADTLESDKAVDDTEPPEPESLEFHFDRGMAVPFEVKTTNTAAMPPTSGTVVARDWSFELPPLSPGTVTLTFRNDGRQDHSLALGEWGDGVAPDAAKAAFETLLAADADNPPPDEVPRPDDLAFAGPLSAGGQATFTVELKPNRSYVLACYMSDRSGGPLHAFGKRMVGHATTPPG